jgi:hypothetical protein
MINLLVLVFALTAVVALVRARRGGAAPRAIAMLILVAAVIGLANACLPVLAALRDRSAAAQPVMVLGLTGLLLWSGRSTGGRAYFRTADVGPLIALHGWRLLFGVLLLLAGLDGGLPARFFWSVAIGDIIAGLWALTLWRRATAKTRELKLWSLFGLVDLLHLLPRAVLTLPPYYATHPDLFRPILLPLLGVPMLIALHVLLLLRFIADGKIPEGISPQPRP